MKFESFENTFKDSTSNFTKVKNEDYKPNGKFPIIDQGQTFIGGYTDNEADGLSFNVLSITGGTYNLVGGDIEITPTSVTAPVNLSIEYTDDYCFPLVDTFNISFEVIIGTGSLNLPETLTACNNLMVDLDAGAGFNSYLWSTGEVTQIISVNVATVFMKVLRL